MLLRMCFATADPRRSQTVKRSECNSPTARFLALTLPSEVKVRQPDAITSRVLIEIERLLIQTHGVEDFFIDKRFALAEGAHQVSHVLLRVEN